MNTKSENLRILISFLLIFGLGTCCFVLNCSRKQTPDKVVVAKVGSKEITADEFKFSYELGLPHLKKGPEPKLAYLNYMINEELLALEGYKLGMNKAERVQALENELMDELLVEELFIKEVHDKIKIAPEDVKDAVMKSKVQWKFRYWVEPNLEYANSVCAAMKKDGYSKVVSEILRSNPEVELKPEKFETDYITWLDVSPELLEAIKDLPVGEISNPVEMNGVFFIFQIVDIRREPITDYDYQTKRDSYKNILFAREAKQRAGKFVSEFMTPKNVVTKGDPFRTLTNGLFEWYKTLKDSSVGFQDAVEAAKDEKSALYKLKAEQNKVLVTFEGGQWTIADFMDRFNENVIKMENPGINDFRSEVNQHIAIKVRNYFFTAEAKKRKLDKSPTVKQQMRMWQDKWVYEELRDEYIDGLEITDEQAKDYFDKFKDKYKIRWDDNPTYKQYAKNAKRDAYIRNAQSILQGRIDSLKTVYPVVINQAVLDTITVLQSEKSKWMSMQVFKRSSNRLARPLIDPAWGF